MRHASEKNAGPLTIISTAVLVTCLHGWGAAAGTHPVPPASAANIFDIIPSPKELKVEPGKAVLSGIEKARAIIVVGAESRKSMIAAGEINDKIVSLGGQALAVIKDRNMARGENAEQNLILVGGLGENTLLSEYREKHGIGITPDNPGEQGYIIRFLKESGRDVAILAGSDPQGALYAAVTFRKLLTREEETIVAQRVSIRDWPDFKNRYLLFPTPFPEHIGDSPSILKNCADWLLRHKINMATSFRGGYRSRDDFEKTLSAEIRSWDGYLRERGIKLVLTTAPGIAYKTDRAKYPDAVPYDEVRYVGRVYFCWSRDEHMANMARNIGQVIRDRGIDYLMLHSPDGSNEEFHDRCQLCKKKYRDDERHLADANMYRIFEKHARAANPDIKLVYIMRPYAPREMSADVFREWERYDYEGYIKKMEPLFPKDVIVCSREGRRKTVEEFRRLYSRSLCHYIEWSVHGLGGGFTNRPIFSSACRTFRTSYFDDANDILMSVSDDFEPLKSAGAAEFAWNVNAPGAEDYQHQYDTVKDGREPAEILDHLVPRACNDFWGREIGPFMAKVYQGNTNKVFIRHPEKAVATVNKTRRRRGLPMIELNSIVKQQVDALKIGEQALIDALALNPTLEELSERYFVLLYKQTHMHRLLAEQNYHYIMAKEQLGQDNVEAAEKHVREGMRTIDGMYDRWLTVKADLKGRRNKLPSEEFFNDTTISDMRVPITPATFEPLKAKFKDLMKNPRLHSKQPKMSPEVRKDILERKVYAGITSQPPRIDGSLDDKAWEKVAAVRNFSAHHELKLARQQTEVKILYDKDFLYLGFKCWDSGIDKLRARSKERDNLGDDDMIEVFLDTNHDQRTYFHLMLNALGTQYDEAGRDRSWDASWESAAKVGKDGWTAEIALPFAEIGGPPVSGKEWGINLARSRIRPDEPAAFSLIKYFGPDVSFHAPYLFAHLYFSDVRN